LHLTTHPTRLPPTALTSFNYTSPNTGVTFVFNNTPVSSTAAQQQCQMYGGNLVSYMSLEEQQEVEAVFIERGDLVPSFHESYWLGLYSASVKPAQFNWADQLSGTLNWTHWGVYKWEGETAQEPNNLFGQENCGAANATQVYQDAFGWMDLNCNIRMPFMCRLIGECPATAALPVSLPTHLPACLLWMLALGLVQQHNIACHDHHTHRTDNTLSSPPSCRA
jgi:hypothetical protein